MGFSLFLIVLKSGLFSGSSSQHSFMTSTTNFGVVSKAARRGRNGISDDLSAILDMISKMKSPINTKLMVYNGLCNTVLSVPCSPVVTCWLPCVWRFLVYISLSHIVSWSCVRCGT